MQNKNEPQMIEIEVDDDIINALEQRRIDPNESYNDIISRQIDLYVEPHRNDPNETREDILKRLSGK